MRLPNNIEDVQNFQDFNEKINDWRRLNFARQLINNNNKSDTEVQSIANKLLPEYIPDGIDVNKNRELVRKYGIIGFYFLVRNKGEFDYKQKNKKFGLYEDFGNAHYAAMFEELMLPRSLAKTAAGIAQIKAGTSPLGEKPSIFEWINDPSRGDDPKDQEVMKKLFDLLDMQDLDPPPEVIERVKVPLRDIEENNPPYIRP